MRFTIEDIARQFDSGTFARGHAYANDGRVAAVYRNAERIEGEVHGSGRSVYRQLIRVAEGRSGIQFKGDCSCPMSYNCKHVVATLLASLDAGAGNGEDGLSFDAEQWLELLAMVQDAARAAAASAYAPNPSARMVYVLMPDAHDDTLELYACKAKLRKDGSIASATIHTDLHGLLFQRPAYLGPADEEPLRLLAALRTGGMHGEGTRPAGRFGARLLSQLCAEGRLWLAQGRVDLRRGDLYPVAAGPLRQAALAWREAGDGDAIGLAWQFDTGAPIGAVLATDPPCYLDDGMLGELMLPQAVEAVPPPLLVQLVARAPVIDVEERTGMAARLAALGLDRIVPVPKALAFRERNDLAPVPHLLLDCAVRKVRGQYFYIDCAQLTFDYDGVSTAGMDDGEGVLRRVAGDAVEIIVRDSPAEVAALETLHGIGFTGFGDDAAMLDLDDALALPMPADWLAFVRDGIPRLEAAGWQIEFGDNYRYELAEVQEWYAELAEEDDRQGAGAWFELELGILVEGERHALLPLLLTMIREAPQQFDPQVMAARPDDAEMLVELPDSTRIALPWARIKPILATLGELYFTERTGNALRLPITDAARLAALDAAAQLRWAGGERLRELGRRLDTFDGIRLAPPPTGLQAQLRPYQLSGLAWMQFLREYGFGGILADDMGLGKTIQTLAHILVEKEAGRLDAPALVVAPTSLMGNWQAEAARFAPGLRVLLLHGKDRAGRFDQVADADLVLTTYPLLARDEEALRKHRFHLLILDEAQYIKNSRARAAQVACLLDARHRLCLTGTPVQNHLGELWSQFHFLMPGFLGDEKAFNTRFRKPIEGRGDGQRKDLLARRLKPFMLRRTKDKVATELPPKTEIVLPVEFGAAQRDLYETVRVAMDRKVRDEIERKGLARSQIVILDALLKLRQVCCDPRLLRADSTAGSGKLETLMELLDTLLSEGRKVLVFSQFTSMLALIEAELRGRGIDYALLTGDTADRTTPVAAFQQGQVSIFLISLKAGGVGLNLTAADTVIHYDPWWNPASENQATDRAWRIGQEQPVFVYKLIARGTLEEKIQELQRRKGELADAVLAPEAGSALAIGPDELRSLLALAAA